MTLHLVAFGPPLLTKDGAPVAPELAWRKHFALLVYLARSPGLTRRRDHLVGLLWPDKDEAKARHSLNEACRAIRRGAGEGALATAADAITLAADCLAADWQEAETALGAGDAARAAELWRGDFLEGFGIPDATPFEDWLAAERLHWRVRFRDALTAEAERLLREGAVTRGLALAARVLAFEPSAEAALRVAMTCEALAGAAPAALERYAAYTAWLKRELGGEPAGDLAALAGRIRAGLRTGRGARSADDAAPAPPPLVGRANELAAISRRLPRRGAGLAVVIITGAPGHGRSRLVREAAERARLAGAAVAATGCVAADADVPGAVLADLVRGGLAAAAGFGAAPPEALAALAALEPDLAQRYPGIAAGERPAPAQLGRAFGAALAAAADETPLLVAVDDAHLADDATLESLPAALREAAAAPVTVILSARPGGEVPAALTELRARVGHDVPGLEIVVDPLGDREVEALAAALLPAYDAGQRERLVRRLRQEAAGVPLYIVEILRALAAGGPTAEVWPLAGETTAQPLPFKVPGAVTAAVTLRVAALPPDTRATLLAAAVLGERVDEALLADVTNAARADGERRLGELERAGFLEFDGARYRFGAEMVRASVTALMLTGAERRRLHDQAAAALARLGGGETLALAEHLYGAGVWREAAAVAGRVQAAAHAAGRPRLAARAARLKERAASRATAG